LDAGEKNAKKIDYFVDVLKTIGHIVYMMKTKQQGDNIMTQQKTVTLTDYTNQEFDFLAEMIHEKLIDMGYENDGSFAFSIDVTFEQETTS